MSAIVRDRPGSVQKAAWDMGGKGNSTEIPVRKDDDELGYDHQENLKKGCWYNFSHCVGGKCYILIILFPG